MTKEGVRRIGGLSKRNKILLVGGVLIVLGGSGFAWMHRPKKAQEQPQPTISDTKDQEDVLSKTDPPKEEPKPAPAPKPQAQPAKLIWQQDFASAASGAPDARYWNVATPSTPVYNEEAQKYTAGSENVRVAGGKLILQAHQNGSGYTSGRIDTMGKVSVSVGSRVEASIKLPKGQGVWPAFWMLSANQPFTTRLHPTDADWETERFYMWDGEIDIMEAYGNHPNSVEGTVYTFGKDQQLATAVAGSADGFHTYWLEWRADSLVWGVDGKTYMTYKKPSTDPKLWPYTDENKMYIILNLAMGGTGGGAIVPAAGDNWAMEVASVRILRL